MITRAGENFRYPFKFRAAYALNEQWSFGATLQVQSGACASCRACTRYHAGCKHPA